MFGAQLVLPTVLTGTSQSPHCVGRRRCDVMPPRHLRNAGAHVTVHLDEAFHARLACPVPFGQGQGYPLLMLASGLTCRLRVLKGI